MESYLYRRQKNNVYMGLNRILYRQLEGRVYGRLKWTLYRR